MNKATRGSVAVFVAAFLLLGTGCGEAPIPSTPERTARGVVQALQDKDVHAYLSLCSNRADLVELMEGADLSEADEEKARGKLDRHVERNEQDRRENFADLVRGRDWSRTRFVGVETTPLEKKYGIEGHEHVWVQLEAEGRESFVLEIDAVVRMSRGWLVMDDTALAVKARIPKNRGRPRPVSQVAEAPSITQGRLVDAPPVEEAAERALPARGRAPSTPEALARDVVAFLQHGDLRGYLAACGWREDVEAILATATLSAEQRAKAQAEIRDNIDRLPQARRKSFRRIHGRNDWSKAQVGKVELTDRVVAEFEETGIDQCNAEVEITGPTPGTLYIRALMRAPRGWVVMDDTPLSWNPD